jgi:hypothetical protein
MLSCKLLWRKYYVINVLKLFCPPWYVPWLCLAPLANDYNTEDPFWWSSTFPVQK